jgi:hypothetical protein
VFAAAPLAVIAATPPLHDQGSKAVRVDDNLVPVSGTVKPSVTVNGDNVRLAWQPSGAGRTFYRVLRAKNDGVACAGRLRDAADNCVLYMDTVGTTSSTSFVDHPPPGTWSYRIGVSANWLNDVRLGDVYVVSRPVAATVR